MEHVILETDSRTRVRAFVLFLLCVSALLVFIYILVDTSESNRKSLRVVFLDVGQGDAIYIESPSGRQVLIDGGRDRSVLRMLTREMGFFDRSLDMVMMTHEDLDHVGGLPYVFERYRVGTFIRTENQGDSGAAELIDHAEVTERAAVIYARRGATYDLGEGAMLTILFPDRDPKHLESNTSSIVARLTYGESEFVFTGDSPDEIEHYLVGLDCAGLRSDVLKLGHHGSRTSTSEEYLACVQPKVGVVSAGKDNRYGHPHSEVTDRLHAHGIDIASTALSGSLVFESDGNTIVRTH